MLYIIGILIFIVGFVIGVLCSDISWKNSAYNSDCIKCDGRLYKVVDLKDIGSWRNLLYYKGRFLI